MNGQSAVKISKMRRTLECQKLAEETAPSLMRRLKEKADADSSFRYESIDGEELKVRKEHDVSGVVVGVRIKFPYCVFLHSDDGSDIAYHEKTGTVTLCIISDRQIWAFPDAATLGCASLIR